MLQFDCGLGSVIIYLFFFFFFFFLSSSGLSSSGFFLDSEGAKKRVLRVCGNVQRKILCNWIDNLDAVYEFHVQILTIFKLNMKGWMVKVHPHRKLFILHDFHVQYRLYSNWTWKTGWKRMHPQALYFACIKIANVWPVGPYLCGQIASQNRPVMGTCSVW